MSSRSAADAPGAGPAVRVVFVGAAGSGKKALAAGLLQLDGHAASLLSDAGGGGAVAPLALRTKYYSAALELAVLPAPAPSSPAPAPWSRR